MNDLEKQFHRAMVGIYETAKHELGYNATYLLRMISDYGGLEAAKRLLATDKPSEGFGTLLLHERLDLSVEAHVVKPEFAELFTADEIEIAENRLEQYGFRFDI